MNPPAGTASVRTLGARTAVAVLLALPAIAAPAAAGTPPLEPLPGRAACGYPPEALRSLVAGPVLFTAQVRPDGSVKSIDLRQVPAKGLGFEEAVRDCVSRWRFPPAAGRRLRRYEGEVRYRVAKADEEAVRALLEAFASAWNAKNSEAVAALVGAGPEREAAGAGSPPSSPAHFASERAAADWNMELEPGFQHIQFLRSDVAVVRQPFHRRTPDGRRPTEKQPSLIEATARRRGASWTLVAWYPLAGPPAPGRWLFPGIEEPRQVKHVAPVYPTLALEAPVSAVVTLEVEVDAAGHVGAARVLQGGRPFDDAAMRAVRQWEYAPTLLEGVPVPVVIRVEVPFDLSAPCPACVTPLPAVH